MKPKIQIKKLRTSAPLIPEYATQGSAGLDIRACHEITLLPHKQILMPTGYAININCPSIAAVLIPRSGLGHKNGIVLGNLVGLIDSDYQQEVFISLWNRSEEEFSIYEGDRIAQLVFVPVIQVEFDVVDEFTNKTERLGGLGSTGIS